MVQSKYSPTQNQFTRNNLVTQVLSPFSSVANTRYTPVCARLPEKLFPSQVAIPPLVLVSYTKGYTCLKSITQNEIEFLDSLTKGFELGKGLGDIYANRYLFRENFRFPQKGTYRFELIQAMRVNPLLGIMDAGIRIEKEK